jgi:predicted XRE-type DNA-binding protein
MKRVSEKTSKTSIITGSGNVFTDLRLPNAEEKQTKVRLAVTINQIIASANLSQAAAAAVLKLNQPKISALANYRLEGFSVERLMNFLNALGRDVEIVIRKAPGRRTPKIRVTAA